MKYTNWYNSLSPETREHMDSLPIWYNLDMFVAFIIGFVVGVLAKWML